MHIHSYIRANIQVWLRLDVYAGTIACTYIHIRANIQVICLDANAGGGIPHTASPTTHGTLSCLWTLSTKHRTLSTEH